MEIRGEKAILVSDVAELYGVETREINQAVRNNTDKFPDGYLIELTKEEKAEVIKNFDNPKVRYSPALPTAFTEKGLYILGKIRRQIRMGVTKHKLTNKEMLHIFVESQAIITYLLTFNVR